MSFPVGAVDSSRYFPEINDDRSSNPNLSPLNEIIQELKRKNVVASAASGGPQLALDSRSDPWGSSEVAFGVEDDSGTVSFGGNDRSSSMLPIRPSLLSAFGNSKRESSAGLQQLHQNGYESLSQKSQRQHHADSRDARSNGSKLPHTNGQDTPTNATKSRRIK